MKSTMLHICMETDAAPQPDAAFELGTRWVCECGINYVFHEGFNRGGGYAPQWFAAPALPKPRRPLSQVFFGPRKG